MTLEVTLAGSDAERELGRSIRHAVFVVEQAVPAEVEVDGLDPDCTQFLARVDGVPVATARARVTGSGYKLERVAVLQPYRRRAIGEALVRYMLEAAPAAAVIYVHAQQAALGFWERVGFSAAGPAFVEGGISHRFMRLVRPAREA
jgi:predicted GNAT family N-acyltransferase